MRDIVSSQNYTNPQRLSRSSHTYFCQRERPTQQKSGSLPHPFKHPPHISRFGCYWQINVGISCTSYTPPQCFCLLRFSPLSAPSLIQLHPFSAADKTISFTCLWDYSRLYPSGADMCLILNNIRCGIRDTDNSGTINA